MPDTATDALRILLADDHEVFRRGLRSLLEARSDWQICGEAGNGLEATRLIRQQLPSAEIVILSQYEASIMAKTASQAGARAYVAKSQISRELLAAVDSAAQSLPTPKPSRIREIPASRSSPIAI